MDIAMFQDYLQTMEAGIAFMMKHLEYTEQEDLHKVIEEHAARLLDHADNRFPLSRSVTQSFLNPYPRARDSGDKTPRAVRARSEDSTKAVAGSHTPKASSSRRVVSSGSTGMFGRVNPDRTYSGKNPVNIATGENSSEEEAVEDNYEEDVFGSPVRKRPHPSWLSHLNDIKASSSARLRARTTGGHINNLFARTVQAREDKDDYMCDLIEMAREAAATPDKKDDKKADPAADYSDDDSFLTPQSSLPAESHFKLDDAGNSMAGRH